MRVDNTKRDIHISYKGKPGEGSREPRVLNDMAEEVGADKKKSKKNKHEKGREFAEREISHIVKNTTKMLDTIGQLPEIRVQKSGGEKEYKQTGRLFKDDIPDYDNIVTLAHEITQEIPKIKVSAESKLKLIREKYNDFLDTYYEAVKKTLNTARGKKINFEKSKLTKKILSAIDKLMVKEIPLDEHATDWTEFKENVNKNFAFLNEVGFEMSDLAEETDEMVAVAIEQGGDEKELSKVKNEIDNEAEKLADETVASLMSETVSLVPDSEVIVADWEVSQDKVDFKEMVDGIRNEMNKILEDFEDKPFLRAEALLWLRQSNRNAFNNHNGLRKRYKKQLDKAQAETEEVKKDIKKGDNLIKEANKIINAKKNQENPGLMVDKLIAILKMSDGEPDLLARLRKVVDPELRKVHKTIHEKLKNREEEGGRQAKEDMPDSYTVLDELGETGVLFRNFSNTNYGTEGNDESSEVDGGFVLEAESEEEDDPNANEDEGKDGEEHGGADNANEYSKEEIMEEDAGSGEQQGQTETEEAEAETDSKEKDDEEAANLPSQTTKEVSKAVGGTTPNGEVIVADKESAQNEIDIERESIEDRQKEAQAEPRGTQNKSDKPDSLLKKEEAINELVSKLKGIVKETKDDDWQAMLDNENSELTAIIEKIPVGEKANFINGLKRQIALIIMKKQPIVGDENKVVPGEYQRWVDIFNDLKDRLKVIESDLAERLQLEDKGKWTMRYHANYIKMKEANPEMTDEEIENFIFSAEVDNIQNNEAISGQVDQMIGELSQDAFNGFVSPETLANLSQQTGLSEEDLSCIVRAQEERLRIMAQGVIRQRGGWRRAIGKVAAYGVFGGGLSLLTGGMAAGAAIGAVRVADTYLSGRVEARRVQQEIIAFRRELAGANSDLRENFQREIIAQIATLKQRQINEQGIEVSNESLDSAEMGYMENQTENNRNRLRLHRGRRDARLRVDLNQYIDNLGYQGEQKDTIIRQAVALNTIDDDNRLAEGVTARNLERQNRGWLRRVADSIVNSRFFRGGETTQEKTATTVVFVAAGLATRSVPGVRSVMMGIAGMKAGELLANYRTASSRRGYELLREINAQEIQLNDANPNPQNMRNIIGQARAQLNDRRFQENNPVAYAELRDALDRIEQRQIASANNIIEYIEQRNNATEETIRERLSQEERRDLHRTAYQAGGFLVGLVGPELVDMAVDKINDLRAGGTTVVSLEAANNQNVDVARPSEAPIDPPIVPEGSPKSLVDMDSVAIGKGDSIWSSAEKVLSTNETYRELVESSNGSAKQALTTYNIDRLKDLIVANPENYGLPKGVDFDRLGVDQLKGIKWQKAFDAMMQKGGLTDNLTTAQVESIVQNNEVLRDFFAEPKNANAPRTSANFEAILNGHGDSGNVANKVGQVMNTLGNNNEVPPSGGQAWYERPSEGYRWQDVKFKNDHGLFMSHIDYNDHQELANHARDTINLYNKNGEPIYSIAKITGKSDADFQNRAVEEAAKFVNQRQSALMTYHGWDISDKQIQELGVEPWDRDGFSDSDKAILNFFAQHKEMSTTEVRSIFEIATGNSDMKLSPEFVAEYYSTVKDVANVDQQRDIIALFKNPGDTNAIKDLLGRAGITQGEDKLNRVSATIERGNLVLKYDIARNLDSELIIRKDGSVFWDGPLFHENRWRNMKNLNSILRHPIS